MLEEKRGIFQDLSQKTGQFFSRIPIGPNGYTFLAIVFVIISFYFLISFRFFLATLFFAFSAVLDFVDGSVARFFQKATKFGAYLDTISDRYVEAIILMGFLFSPLPKVFLPSFVWIFLALLGSFMTTYSKAAAKEKEIVKEELKIGFFGRGERVILILVSMFLGIINDSLIIYPLIIFAIVSNLTAFQRIFLVLSREKKGKHNKVN